MKKKLVSRIFLGVLILALGTILCGNAMGIWDVDVFFPGWWTLFIIIPCLYFIVVDGPDFGNVIGLVVGVVLLLSKISIFKGYISWRIILPIIIIIIGIKVIVSAVGDTHRTYDGYNYSKKSSFCDDKVDFGGQTFTGGPYKNSFGKLIIDLSGAVIAQSMPFTVDCSFGETDIILPKGVSLNIKSNVAFGDVKNMYPTSQAGIPLDIVINCSFGTVKVF